MPLGRKLKAICWKCEEPFVRGDDIVQVAEKSGANQRVRDLSWHPEHFAHKHCVERPTKKTIFAAGPCRTWGNGTRRAWAWRRPSKEQVRLLGELPEPTPEEVKQSEAVMALIEGEVHKTPLTIERVFQGGIRFMKRPEPDKKPSDDEERNEREGKEPKQRLCGECAVRIEVGEKYGKVGGQGFCRRCVRRFLKRVETWFHK